jgi:hypothetical protein
MSKHDDRRGGGIAASSEPSQAWLTADPDSRPRTSTHDLLLSLGLTATGASTHSSRRQAREGARAEADLRRPGTPARWTSRAGDHADIRQSAAFPGDPLRGADEPAPAASARTARAEAHRGSDRVPVWNGLPPYVRWK